ncbi:MAG: hypothetical protein Q9M20_02275 [Mariprofundaceae bacterium]|nr:hypothetical protein [Mariprofundaceae bacterium]
MNGSYQHAFPPMTAGTSENFNGNDGFHAMHVDWHVDCLLRNVLDIGLKG